MNKQIKGLCNDDIKSVHSYLKKKKEKKEICSYTNMSGLVCHSLSEVFSFSCQYSTLVHSVPISFNS